MSQTAGVNKCTAFDLMIFETGIKERYIRARNMND